MGKAPCQLELWSEPPSTAQPSLQGLPVPPGAGAGCLPGGSRTQFRCLGALTTVQGLPAFTMVNGLVWSLAKEASLGTWSLTDQKWMVGYMKNKVNTDSYHLLSLHALGALSELCASQDIFSFNLRGGLDCHPHFSEKGLSA